MTEELHLILNVAVAVVIALGGGLVAHALRQPPILGYLVAGMLIGPFTPGFIGDREEIAGLAEVGVIFLMFALGIEFSLKELGRVKGVALLGTTLQIALTIAAGVGLGVALGWPLLQGLFFGAIIAISSTMVILKILIDRGEIASNHGRVLLGMLIVQDLVVVMLMVLLPKLAADAQTATIEVVLATVRALVFVGATLFLGTRVVPRLMARVERLNSSELFLLTAVALALGSAALSAWLGLSPALGAFLAGLLLTETEFDQRVIAEVVPMRNLFATLFFVSVGMLIDPGFILDNLLAVAGMALFIIVVKALVTLVATLPFGLGGRATVFVSLGMIQIGEFSYLLARAGEASGAIPPRLHNLILTSSLVTILLTPAAFALAPSLTQLLARLPGLGRPFRAHLAPMGAHEALRQHAIVVGYGRVGRLVVAGLQAAGLPALVIEQDLHLAREIARAGLPVIYGDAAYPTIMEAARIEQARLIVVALPDAGATRAVVRNARQANSSIPILARVARADYDERVRLAGATTIIAPERAGARMLLDESARLLGLPASVMDPDLPARAAQPSTPRA